MAIVPDYYRGDPGPARRRSACETLHTAALMVWLSVNGAVLLGVGAFAWQAWVNPRGLETLAILVPLSIALSFPLDLAVCAAAAVLRWRCRRLTYRLAAAALVLAALKVPVLLIALGGNG